jgi:serine/threonine protein kinase/tetratricopeptide (TPR) repeat protein
VPDNLRDDDSTRSFVPLTQGTEVGHYKIISKIGAGGMGEVYLAEDTKLKRRVALKFLPHHYASDKDLRERFTREAQAAAKLDHPNIVPVHEVGEYQGRPFFAMAHIEGQSLRDVIKDGCLGVNEAIDLTMQICEGLHKAHEAGVVHRDIKPSNIIIDNDGRARLVDFGLAMVSGEDKLTKTGSTLGTVGYMSPEQIVGTKVDHRSDLFSVGVILYEMLTGRRPFEGDNDAAVVKAITDSTPEPVARFKSGITGEIQQIVDKALSKDPSLRYQHADGMLADLKRYSMESHPGVNQRPQRRSSNLIKRFLVPSLVLVIAVLVFVLKPFRFEVQPTKEVAAAESRLAIMYFDNLADPDDSLRMGEIATNLLITDLSESEYLNVVSSQHLYDLLKQFGGKELTVIDRDIASQLAHKAKARWMVLGKILKCEPNFVITTELIDVSAGSTMATQRIDGSPDADIFQLVDSLTIKIKEDLNLAPGSLEEPDPSVAGITTNSIEAYRYYLAALDDLAGYRFPQMVKNVKSCLAIDSTFAMAYYWASWLAGGALRDEFIGKALEYSEGASEKEQLYIKGRKAFFERDHSLHMEYLKQIIAKYPDDKEAHYRLGGIYYAHFYRPANAIPHYLAAIEVDPQYAEAYNMLSSAYFETGDFEKAIFYVGKYIKYSDSAANAFDTRGEYYGFIGKPKKAIESYQIALEKEPDFWATLEHLGMIYVSLGNYSEAEKYFKRLVLLESASYRSIGRFRLSYIPLHQGKLADAIQVLDDGINAGKMEHITLHDLYKSLLKVRIYRELDDYESAENELNKTITAFREISPEREIEIGHYKTELLADQRKFDKALEAAEDFRNAFKNDSMVILPRYRYLISYIEYLRENYEQSIEYAMEACENSLLSTEDHYKFHAMLGRGYLASGQLGEAVTEFEQLINIYGDPKWLNPLVSLKLRYWLGMAYEASGWTNKAIEQYEIFLDIWKNADEGIKSVEDAKTRLARLKSGS